MLTYRVVPKIGTIFLNLSFGKLIVLHCRNNDFLELGLYARSSSKISGDVKFFQLDKVYWNELLANRMRDALRELISCILLHNL